MMSSTFGAPLGGTILAGQHGLESVALRLITPPKPGGGDGTYFPSMVVVALMEHGVPVVCWALTVHVTGTNSRKKMTSRIKPRPCQNSFSILIEFIPRAINGWAHRAEFADTARISTLDGIVKNNNQEIIT